MKAIVQAMLRRLALCLILGGVLFFGCSLAFSKDLDREETEAGKYVGAAMAQLREQIPETESVPSTETEAETVPETVSETVPETEAPTEAETRPTIATGGIIYYGYVDIPALGLSLPVQDAWDYEEARKSPCRYLGDAEGILILAAHNYAEHFGRIGELSIGDAIRFTDGAGRVWNYQVALIEVLGEYEVDRMEQTDYPLTLFTCNTYGDERITVRCTRA